jgi:hypothetical protein
VSAPRGMPTGRGRPNGFVSSTVSHSAVGLADTGDGRV